MGCSMIHGRCKALRCLALGENASQVAANTFWKLGGWWCLGKSKEQAAVADDGDDEPQNGLEGEGSGGDDADAFVEGLMMTCMLLRISRHDRPEPTMTTMMIMLMVLTNGYHHGNSKHEATGASDTCGVGSHEMKCL